MEQNNLTEQVLTNLRIDALNPMQEAAIDSMANNNELVLISATGSGKTIAFLLPIINWLQKDKKETQALIIVPSLVQTSLAEKLVNTPEKIEAGGKRHALQRIGQPNDIAAMAEFLLSEKAGWITGQVLHIDGGMSTLKV